MSRQANREADPDGDRYRTEKHAHHPESASSQRDADAKLTGTTGHRVCHRSVQPNASQQQGDRTEQADKPSKQALLSQEIIDLRFLRFELGKWKQVLCHPRERPHQA